MVANAHASPDAAAWLAPRDQGADWMRPLARFSDALARDLATRAHLFLRQKARFDAARCDVATMELALERWQGRVIGAPVFDHAGAPAGALGVERRLVAALAAAVFGAGAEETESDREPTAIDIALARELLGFVTQSLQACAPSHCALSLAPLQKESPRAPAALRESRILCVRIAVALMGAVGHIECLLAPQTSGLTPETRTLAEPQVMASAPRIHVESTRVTLRAELDDSSLRLADIAALEIGALVPLAVTSRSPITLRASGYPAFSGLLGQSGARLAVKIEASA